MKIFTHTSSETGLWRGWLRNGQSVEVSWGRRGWEFGGIVTIHGNAFDRGRRLLNVSLWRLSIWLPLGTTDYPWEPMDGPRWGISASREFGFCLYWNHRRKSFGWPWHWHTLAFETRLENGDWRDLDWQQKQSLAHREQHPYTYKLRSGKIQNRIATITHRRHILTWKAFRRIGWPRWIKESIDIEFNDEVGERTGSWKGGCIGCGYDLKKGETLEQALRRMERERVFR